MLVCGVMSLLQGRMLVDRLLWPACQVVAVDPQQSTSAALTSALGLVLLLLEHRFIIPWTWCGKAGAGATRLMVFPKSCY